MPNKEIIEKFMLLQNKWVRVSGESELLTDYLQRYDLEIPYGCEFMRFRNNKIRCWVYVQAMCITIKIFNKYD